MGTSSNKCLDSKIFLVRALGESEQPTEIIGTFKNKDDAWEAIRKYYDWDDPEFVPIRGKPDLYEVLSDFGDKKEKIDEVEIIELAIGGVHE